MTSHLAFQESTWSGLQTHGVVFQLLPLFYGETFRLSTRSSRKSLALIFSQCHSGGCGEPNILPGVWFGVVVPVRKAFTALPQLAVNSVWAPDFISNSLCAMCQVSRSTVFLRF